MYRSTLFRSFFLLALAFGSVTAIAAQETMPTPAPAVEKPVDFRTNALRQLGLTRDQLQRIRVMNQERKPLMDAAQVRLRQANRALDEAIYSDTATESDFQARLKEFQLAQGEVARIRYLNEFGVRRILTPEQLTRFRIMSASVSRRRGPLSVRPMTFHRGFRFSSVLCDRY
ncbi:MAG: hypothetical protein QM785_13600 [Pyrinomonadaceae bacterium]